MLVLKSETVTWKIHINPSVSRTFADRRQISATKQCCTQRDKQCLARTPPIASIVRRLRATACNANQSPGNFGCGSRSYAHSLGSNCMPIRFGQIGVWQGQSMGRCLFLLSDGSYCCCCRWSLRFFILHLLLSVVVHTANERIWQTKQ